MFLCAEEIGQYMSVIGVPYVFLHNKINGDKLDKLFNHNRIQT